jgi:hypothetical protein
VRDLEYTACNTGHGQAKAGPCDFQKRPGLMNELSNLSPIDLQREAEPT